MEWLLDGNAWWIIAKAYMLACAACVAISIIYWVLTKSLRTSEEYKKRIIDFSDF